MMLEECSKTILFALSQFRLKLLNASSPIKQSLIKGVKKVAAKNSYIEYGIRTKK
jgi:hypothetical protein